ncbi:NYN domain-containing protein [Massilia sp. HP4]|uniref:NYN domain-containing protein n=1 Tax=Massilia sp. HP4 TaxID=2562316 RepID=UPI0010C06E52|nr:NYN domain-containing protein [Massilia sp. HP4]
MASSSDNISMAVFCDFENVALGVRDANYEKFDIKPVLERLLLKGSIVVKKSYCDWDRYKGFKAAMHEANFELIEIPHVRQSGKNSADIRLVVDALDLCYTKSHVNTFVIISGDSDFSPLVSKLRENAKQVIGVGVKQSTSDLLVANCDEFIFYDDLVREKNRATAKRKEEQEARKGQSNRRSGSTAGASDDKRKEELEARKVQALDMVVETFDALVSERGDTGKIWASLLKDTLKRRRPDFSETYYGFRTFGNLLEEAQTRGLFEFGRDEKSGTYVYRSANAPLLAPGLDSAAQDGAETVVEDGIDAATPVDAAPEEAAKPDTRRGRGRGGRKQGGRGESSSSAPIPALLEPVAIEPDAQPQDEAIEQPASQPTLFVSEPEAPVADAQTAAPAPEEAPAPAKERRRAPRKPSAKKLAEQAALDAAAAAQAATPAVVAPPVDPQPDADYEESDEAIDAAAEAKLAQYDPDRPARKAPARKAAPGKAAPRKAAPRSRRPAKPKAGSDKG